MVAGHLREQNGIYQMILSYKDKNKKRHTKSISTHLPVKGNKKRAEAMLRKTRREFIPTLWDKDTLIPEFLEEWVETRDLSPNEYSDYHLCLKIYIRPYFDNTGITISTLTSDDLLDFYSSVRNSKDFIIPDEARRTVINCHTLIRTGLMHAQSLGWIDDTPTDGIDPVTGELDVPFADFILDWLEMMKNCVDLNTYANYASSIKKRIYPYFKEKGYTLKDLERNPQFIQEYYQYELDVNGLTTNTVIHRHANIRKCLQYAFQIGKINSNPADRITRPQKNVYVPDYYNGEELEALFKAVKGDPIEIPVILAAFYGLRRSEIVGLKWKSIDFEKKTFTIQHVVTDIYIDGHKETLAKDKTKRQSSTRSLPLVEPFEAALVQLYKRQKAEQFLCGDSYSKEYLDYVLKDKMGNRMKPDYVSNHFQLILKKNNLKRIRFHDLRHSCASLLYANDVDLKSIQEWLGHSTINTTANIYTHFDFSRKVNSANAILGNYPT